MTRQASLEKQSTNYSQTWTKPEEVRLTFDWKPIPNTPQEMAYNSEADVIGYGGAAGGGKSALICGLALTKYKSSLIVRREYTQLDAIERELKQIAGEQGTYNSQKKIFTLNNGNYIDLGAVQHEKDKEKRQGRAHSFLAFDEATHFPLSVITYLSIWNRSIDPNEKCKMVMTFNPPTNVEGRWVIDYFAPWLKRGYPNPAVPGELRWFATLKSGNEVEVESGTPFLDEGEEIIPRSRTFIPASLEDNPYLSRTNYKAVLLSLPEPLRSMMLKGDFYAGLVDDAWQVMPTKWVEAAMDRWRSRPSPNVPQTAIGVDPSRGGIDKTVLAPRYGDWFDRLQAYPGSECIDGAAVAALVLPVLKGDAVVPIDVIAIGSSPYDILCQLGVNAIAVNVATTSPATDRTGKFGFKNLRAELWWKLREALDPAYEPTLALPPDDELLGDLTAARWFLSGFKIQIEDKEDIKQRIGRSPDRGEAVLMATYQHAVGSSYESSFGSN